MTTDQKTTDQKLKRIFREIEDARAKYGLNHEEVERLERLFDRVVFFSDEGTRK